MSYRINISQHVSSIVVQSFLLQVFGRRQVISTVISMSKLNCWDKFHFLLPTHTYNVTSNEHSLHCQATQLVALTDHPVGCVSDKLAQASVGPPWHSPHQHLMQHELVDLYCALHSDIASSKNTMHLQRLRRIFKGCFDLVSPSRQDGLHNESSWLKLIQQWLLFVEENVLNQISPDRLETCVLSLEPAHCGL